MKYPPVKLSELCEVITKGTTPTSIGFEFSDQGIPFLRVGNIFGGIVHYEKDTLFISQDVHTSLKRSQILGGDVLLSIAGTIGRAGVVSTNAPSLNCNQALAIIRPQNAIARRYLRHWLESENAQSQMKSSTVTGTIQNLSLTQVGNLKVPLPPLPEQRRIAAILDQADALRAKRREALAQLDKLTQCIFIEMFGDPVTNPKGWETKNLGAICDVGSSARVFVEELVDSGIPFYRGTEIGQLGNDQVVKPSLFITEEHFEKLKTKTGVPSKGDLLLPSICPDGRIFMVNDDKPFYFKDGRVLWIKVDKKYIESVFLMHQLKNLFYSNYSKIASGTTFAELKIFALKDLVIYMPPINLQNQFACRIKAIKKLKCNQQASLENIDLLFASLQHRAFRGEL